MEYNFMFSHECTINIISGLKIVDVDDASTHDAQTTKRVYFFYVAIIGDVK
jgi:hypothetical protein